VDRRQHPLMNAAGRVEATCLVKVKRRREHRRKLTLTDFPRKIAAWQRRNIPKQPSSFVRESLTILIPSRNSKRASTSFPRKKIVVTPLKSLSKAILPTQPITQRVKHWVVGGIPLPMRERYNLPPDATGIDGIYETHDGNHVAYQVKYRQCPNLTYAEVAPFLGLTERFTDRVIFTNASTLSEKASKRTRWVNHETFLELSPEALEKIEAWLKSKPLPVLRFLPDPNYQTQALAEIKAALEKTPLRYCGHGLRHGQDVGCTVGSRTGRTKDRARSGSIPHAAGTDTSRMERADLLGQSLQLHLRLLR
jgi:hypothetical protein